MASLENNWLKLIGQPQAEAVSSIAGTSAGISTSTSHSTSHSTRIKEVHEEEEKRAATNYPKRPSRCRSYTVFTASSHVVAGQLRSAARPPRLAPATGESTATATATSTAPAPAPDDAHDDAGGAGADDPSRMSSKGINCGLRWGPRAAQPSVLRDIRWLHNDDDDDDGLHGETSTGNLTNWCELAPAELASPEPQHQHQHQAPSRPQAAAQAEPAAAAAASDASGGGRGGRICANKNKKIQLNYYPQDSRMAALNNQVAAALVALVASLAGASSAADSASSHLSAAASTSTSTSCGLPSHTKQFKVRKGTMRPVTGAASLGLNSRLSLSVSASGLYLAPLMLVLVLVMVLLAGPLEGSLVVRPHQQASSMGLSHGQLSGGAKPAAARLIRSAAGPQEAGEHDLLLELLQSTGSLNEANRLIETLIGSKLDSSSSSKPPAPVAPEPPAPDYELIRASGLSTDSSSASSLTEGATSTTTAPPLGSPEMAPPIRVYLPEPLAESHIELTGNGGRQVHLVESQQQQQQHPKHRGLLDEIIEASATARPMNRSSGEPNAKVHYDEAAASSSGEQPKRPPHPPPPPPPGVLLDAARAAELLRASKQIENILSPPPVVEARQVPLAGRDSSSPAPTQTGAGQGATLLASGADKDDEGLSNNESISSLVIGSAAPTRQLIANYSHWIVHERLGHSHSSGRPEAIRFVQAPHLMTTSGPPIIIHRLQQLPALEPPAPPGAAHLPEAGRAAQISSSAPSEASSSPSPATQATSSPTAPASASLTADGFSHEQFLSLGSGQQATHVQHHNQQQQQQQQQQLRRQLKQVSELMQAQQQQQQQHQPELQLNQQPGNREQPLAALKRQVAQVGNGLLPEANLALLTSTDSQQQVASSAPAHKSAEVLEVRVFADTLEPHHHSAPAATETVAKRGASSPAHHNHTTSGSPEHQAYIILHRAVSPPPPTTASAGTPVGALPPARLSTKSWLDLTAGLTGTTKRPARAALSGQSANKGPRRKEPRKDGSKRASGARKKKNRKPKKQVASGDQVVVPSADHQIGRVKAAPGVAHLLLGTSSVSDRLPSSSHPSTSGAVHHNGSGSQWLGAGLEPLSSESPQNVVVSVLDSSTSNVDPISGGGGTSTASSSSSRDNNVTDIPLELDFKGTTSQHPVSSPEPPLYTSPADYLELTRETQWSAKREQSSPPPMRSSALSTSSHFRGAATNLNGHHDDTNPTASTRDMAWWERRPSSSPATTPAPLTSRLIDQLAFGYQNASVEAAMPNEPLAGALNTSQVDASGTRPLVSSSSGLFGKRLVEEASSPTQVAAGAASASKRRPPAAAADVLSMSSVSWMPAADADSAADLQREVANEEAALVPDEGRFLASRQHEGLLNSFSTVQAKPKTTSTTKRLPELTMVHLGAPPRLAEPTPAPLEAQRLALVAGRPQQRAQEVKAVASQLFQYKSANRWPAASSARPQPQPELNPILEPASSADAGGPTWTPASSSSTTQHQLSQHQQHHQHPQLEPELVDVRPPTSTGSPPVPVGSRGGGGTERAKGSQARFNRLIRGQLISRAPAEDRQQPHQSQHQPMNATEQTKAPLTTNPRANNSNRWLLRRGDKQRLVPRHGTTASSGLADSPPASISSSVQVASPASSPRAESSSSSSPSSSSTTPGPDTAPAATGAALDPPTTSAPTLLQQLDGEPASSALNAPRRPLSTKPLSPPSQGRFSSNKASQDTRKQSVSTQQQQHNVHREPKRFTNRRANSIVDVDDELESLSSPASRQQKAASKQFFIGSLEQVTPPPPSGSAGPTTTATSFIIPTTSTLLPDTNTSHSSSQRPPSTSSTTTSTVVADRLAQQSQLQLQFQWPPVATSSSSEGLRRWRQGDRKRRRGEPSSSTSPSSTSSSTSTTSLPIELAVQVSSEPPRLAKARVSLSNLFKRLPGTSFESAAHQVADAAQDQDQVLSSGSPMEDRSRLAEASPSAGLEARLHDASPLRPAQGEPRAGHQLQPPPPHLQVAPGGGSGGGLLADELRASALVKTMINLGAPGGTFQSSASSSPGLHGLAAAMSSAGSLATTGQPPAEQGPRRAIRVDDLHKSGQVERPRHQRRKFIAVSGASGSQFPSVDSRASLDQQAVVWDSAIPSTSTSPSSSSSSSSSASPAGLGQPPAEPLPPLPPPPPQPADLSKAALSEADWRLQMRASRPRHHQSQQPQPPQQPQLQQQAELAASSRHPSGDVSPWTPGAGGLRRPTLAAAPSGQRHAYDRASSTPIAAAAAEATQQEAGGGGGWMLNGSQAHQDTDQAPTTRQLQLQQRHQQQQQQPGAGITTWLSSGTSEAPPTLLVYDELLGSEQSAAPARTTQASQPAHGHSPSPAARESLLDQLLPATEQPDYRPPILGPHHHHHSTSTPRPMNQQQQQQQQQFGFPLDSRLLSNLHLRGTRHTGNATSTAGSAPLLELARPTQLSRSQQIAILIIVFSCGALVLALVAMALSIKCRIAFNKASASNDAPTREPAQSRVGPPQPASSKSLSETKIIKRAVRRSDKVSGARRALREAESKLLLARRRASARHRTQEAASSDSVGSPGADLSSSSEASLNLAASKELLEPVLARRGKTATKLMPLSPSGAPKMPLASRLKHSLKRQKRGKRPKEERLTHRDQLYHPEPASFFRDNHGAGTLRQRISGTITSRLLKMQLPRLLPYFALDYSNNPQQQQHHRATNKHGQFAFDVHQATTSDLQTSNGKKLASPLTVGDLLASGSAIPDARRNMDHEEPFTTRPLPNMEQENFHLKSPGKHMQQQSITNSSRLIGQRSQLEPACDKLSGKEFTRKRTTTKLTGCQCVSCTKAKQEPSQSQSSNLAQEDQPSQHQPLRKPRLPFGAASSVLRQPGGETVTGLIHAKQQQQQHQPEATVSQLQNRRQRAAFFESATYCDTGPCSQGPPASTDVVDQQRNMRKQQTGAIISGELNRHNQQESDLNVSSNQSSIINSQHLNAEAGSFQQFSRQIQPEGNRNQFNGIVHMYQDEDTDNYYHLNNVDYLADGVASPDYQDDFGDSLARGQINQQQVTTNNQLVEAIVCSNNYLCPNGQQQTRSSKPHNQMSDCNCKMVLHPI